MAATAARPAPLCCGFLAIPRLHAQVEHRLRRHAARQLFPAALLLPRGGPGGSGAGAPGRGLRRSALGEPSCRGSVRHRGLPPSAGGGRGLARTGPQLAAVRRSPLLRACCARCHLCSSPAGRPLRAHGMSLCPEPGECARCCAADLGSAPRGPRGPGRESERSGVGSLALEFPAHRGGAAKRRLIHCLGPGLCPCPCACRGLGSRGPR